MDSISEVTETILVIVDNLCWILAVLELLLCLKIKKNDIYFCGQKGQYT